MGMLVMATSALFAQPIACHSNVQISIGPDGYVKIRPQMILSEEFTDYSPFVVSLKNGTTDSLFCDDIGKPHMVTVMDTRNGNKCWSTVRVEDKMPPIITCLNDTLPCYFNPDTVNYARYASAIDNCDDSVELFYSYIIDDFFCDPNFSARVDLRWTATDDMGLTATCQSTIYFEKIDLNLTAFPLDTSVSCTATDSFDTGIPLLDGLPIDVLCEYVHFYIDDTIAGRCSGEYTIERTWTVMDWCPGGVNLEDTQNIFVIDTVPPVIQCPDTIIVGTEATSCTGLFIIPPVIVSDFCGADTLIDTSFMTTGGMVLNTGDTIELDTGVHTFICTAEDDCGNISECEHIVQVVDDVAPTLACIPELTIYLDTVGFSKLCLKDLDHINYYSDNCGIDSITISKMQERCDTSLNPYPGYCVTFCCEEVQQEVMVIITVTDLSGNKNFCMINTEVLDTIPPVIVESPNDTTISCTIDYRDTSLTGGRVIIEDNCLGVLNLKIQDSVDIDSCLEGTVIRSFIACDPSGNADTAFQTITITNSFVFDPSLIRWAMDTCVETCPVDSLPETIGSETFVVGDSCGVVTVTYSDRDISDPSDACLVIERTWTVRNECRSMFEMDSLQIVTIKNYRAPILSGPPLDTTIMVDPDSCFAFVELPELVATDCSTGLTVSNDCSTGGPILRGRFPVGIKVVTYTATDGCGNVSTYQTTIRIVDLTGPSISCPRDTTVNCQTPLDTITLGRPTVSDNCLAVGMITVEFTDVIMPGGCPQEFTIERTFTATDTSGNSNTCLQVITVQDTVAPVISCPNDTIIDCERPRDVMSLGNATATDQCQVSVTDITSRDSLIFGSCPQELTILRIFSAADSCGNRSSCTQTIMVIDTTPPTVICPPDIVVSCGDMTGPDVTGEPDVSDNCDMTVIVTRQDSSVAGINPVLRTIFRRWIGVDACGNADTCLQTIRVEDTEAPSIVCPNDTVVPCNTPLDDLTIFGAPIAMDNCPGFSLEEDTVRNLNICNVGTLTRIFTVTDSVGNVASCEQVITLTLEDTLKLEDIIWPDSIIEVDACIGVDPDSIPRGRPMIDSLGATCFLVSQTFIDSVDYNCVPGVCTTLTRKWTLVDSCQLDTMTGQGIFCFTQEIRVVDTMRPMINVMLPMDTFYLHPDSACNAYVNLTATADDCSGIRNFCNLNPFRTPNKRTGGDARGRYERGCTQVTFIAEDSCCNSDTQFVLVCVLDTIPPMVDCRDLEKRLVGEGAAAFAEFCVSELIVSTMDNCDPPFDIRGSFSPTDPTDTCRIYNCDSLAGAREINRQLTIYFFDASGNATTCVSRVTIRDDFGTCMGAIIGGQVSTFGGIGIENAQVSLSTMGMEEMTSANGSYTFEELPRGEAYTIDVTREEDDPVNGISTADLLAIFRHLLGIESFINPYQLIAADANGNGALEVSDVVELRKLLLGIIPRLRHTPDWQFIDALYPLDMSGHPSDHPEAYQYHVDSLVAHMNIPFIGVRTGDVTGDAASNSNSANATRNLEQLHVDLIQQDLIESSHEVQIAHIVISSEKNIQGLSAELNVSSGIEIKGIYLEGENTEAVHYNLHGNELRILWTDALQHSDETEISVRVDYWSTSADPGQPFKWLGGGVVDDELNEYELVLRTGARALDQEQIRVMQNRPNPFTGETMIGVFTPASGSADLRVNNAAGQVVLHKKLWLENGWNQIVIKEGELPSDGMFLYTISSKMGTQSRRMILSK